MKQSSDQHFYIEKCLQNDKLGVWACSFNNTTIQGRMLEKFVNFKLFWWLESEKLEILHIIASAQGFSLREAC